MIKTIPDFPSKGVFFRHIGPLLKDTESFRGAIQTLLKQIEPVQFDIVGGVDARGFIIATAIQFVTNKPQFMIRKASKLPGDTYSSTYSMEYDGKKTIEIEKESVTKGMRVLLVDDLLATGGTLCAAVDLVHQAGATVAAIGCLIGLDGLSGAEKLKAVAPEARIETVFNYPCDNESSVPRKNVTIKEFRPTKPVGRTPGEPILMWHPSLEDMAQRMLQASNLQPSYVDWSFFNDGWPNITFEPSDTLRNQDLVFLFSMATKEEFAEQMALLIALPRQQINSLTIMIPYVGPATHERVDFSGMLATVEPLMKMISQSIPLTKTGPPIVRILDIHSVHIRFYMSDGIVPKLMSAIPVLKQHLKPRQTIAFPDEGAYKRFKHMFEAFPMVICGKMRGAGEERTVSVRDRQNWPADEDAVLDCMCDVIIVDDLVQSGGTLLACAKALKKDGFKRVAVYVTHGIFPNDSWRKFVGSEDITNFYVTNSNPQVTAKLEGVKPFTVLEIEEHLVREISKDISSVSVRIAQTPQHVYVASTNTMKLEAVAKIYKHPYRIFGVDGLSSCVPEQPFGMEEIERGALNRLDALRKVDTLKPKSLLISVENGIVHELDEYFDVPVVEMYSFGTPDVFVGKKVLIPEQYNKYVREALEGEKRDKTFGSIVEKALGLTPGKWHEHLTKTTRVDQIASALE